MENNNYRHFSGKFRSEEYTKSITCIFMVSVGLVLYQVAGYFLNLVCLVNPVKTMESPVVCHSHTWDSSTCTVVSYIVDNLANLKRTKSNLSIVHNFYSIIQNLS